MARATVVGRELKPAVLRIEAKPRSITRRRDETSKRARRAASSAATGACISSGQAISTIDLGRGQSRARAAGPTPDRARYHASLRYKTSGDAALGYKIAYEFAVRTGGALRSRTVTKRATRSHAVQGGSCGLTPLQDGHAFLRARADQPTGHV